MRLVNARHGMMLVNPNDQYVGRSFVEYGEFSEGEVELFGAFKDLIADGDVCEVGANIGAHTLPLAKICRRIYALEPQRLVFQTLCGNLAFNDVRNAYPMWAAAGNDRTRIVVPDLDPDQGFNFGGLSIEGREEGDSVPLVPIDELEIDDITHEPRTDKTFFCIDVEQTHNFVTSGGVVHNCRPPGNRDPMPDEIEQCEGYLFRQIEAIEPKLVATLGNFATKLLSGKQLGITRVHGQEQEVTLGGRRVLLRDGRLMEVPALTEFEEVDFPPLGRLDAIVTSGGVSVGEEDHVRHPVEAEGSLLMWKIAMKPGRPLAFGKVGEAAFIGLPGNPVSSFVTFLMFVRPFLRRTQGIAEVAPRAIDARADFDWPRPDSRREFLRVKWNPQGGLDLYPTQDSAVLTSTAWADGLVDNPPKHAIAKGERVRFLPFSELYGGRSDCFSSPGCASSSAAPARRSSFPPASPRSPAYANT